MRDITTGFCLSLPKHGKITIDTNGNDGVTYRWNDGIKRFSYVCAKRAPIQSTYVWKRVFAFCTQEYGNRNCHNNTFP
jgi:hypothetical protein